MTKFLKFKTVSCSVNKAFFLFDSAKQILTSQTWNPLWIRHKFCQSLMNIILLLIWPGDKMTQNKDVQYNNEKNILTKIWSKFNQSGLFIIVFSLIWPCSFVMPKFVHYIHVHKTKIMLNTIKTEQGDIDLF